MGCETDGAVMLLSDADRCGLANAASGRPQPTRTQAHMINKNY